MTIGGAGSENGTATCTAGAWTRTLTTPLATDGAYTATATQADTATNTGTSGAKAITVDKTAPVVTLTTVNGAARTFPFTTNATVTSVGGACGTAAGDSATINVDDRRRRIRNRHRHLHRRRLDPHPHHPARADGAYTATATQADNQSNVGTSGAKAITVDKTAPVVTLTTVNGTTRTFPFTTNVDVTTVGGACGTATGDSTTINVTITARRIPSGTATCTAGAWTRTLTTPLAPNGDLHRDRDPSRPGNQHRNQRRANVTVDKTAPVVTLTTVNGGSPNVPVHHQPDRDVSRRRLRRRGR